MSFKKIDFIQNRYPTYENLPVSVILDSIPFIFATL